jgi:hypothetical protein
LARLVYAVEVVTQVASFEYRLKGSGWSEAIFSDGANETVLPDISYLSDALRDLMAAVIKLMEGAKRAEFSWYCEPGEYEWLLTQHKQLLSIRITRHRNWDRVDFRKNAERQSSRREVRYTTLPPWYSGS